MASGAEKRIVLEGKVFNRLTVLVPVREIGRAIKYRCRCSCGTIIVVGGQNLRRGLTQSCGCLHREIARAVNLRHGRSKTRVHNVWLGMIQRCEDKSCEAYPAYGGRGITVCAEWHVFENFYRDMGDPPNGMTLDRENNDLGYDKDNCRWATRRIQANNRRSSKMIAFKGKVLTQAQWERELRLKPGVIWQRLNAGWSIERALTHDLW